MGQKGKKYMTIPLAEVLEKFGRFQVYQYIMTSVPMIVVTMININYVFVAGNLEYRCRVPECDDVNSTSAQPEWWPDHVDRWSRPILKEELIGSNKACLNTSFNSVVEACTEWIYESNDTIVGEMDLASQPWKSKIVGSVHNVGWLFSMPVFGWMSDRYGRKPTLIFCVLGSCIGLLKSFMTSYYPFLVIEFLESAICSGTYAAGTVLMIEIGGKDQRLLAGVLAAYAVYFGESVFALIAMLVPNWKDLIRIIYTIPIVFLPYIYFMHESPRWQIINDKTQQALTTIKKAAKANKIIINEDTEKLGTTDLKKMFNVENYEVKEGLREIFRSREMKKRLLVAVTIRFTAGFIYYGLMVNSVYLPGNKYTNFMLATVMSYPGELLSLYLMNKIGRKMPLIVGYLVCGVVSIASAYTPESLTWLLLTLFLMGKMVISLCYTGAVTYTMELFPTSARGTMLGFCAFSAGVGGIMAPLTPILMEVSAALPSILFGGFAALSSGLLLLTPETKQLWLMDTIEQVEAEVRERREPKIASTYTIDTNL